MLGNEQVEQNKYHRRPMEVSERTGIQDRIWHRLLWLVKDINVARKVIKQTSPVKIKHNSKLKEHMMATKLKETE